MKNSRPQTKLVGQCCPSRAYSLSSIIDQGSKQNVPLVESGHKHNSHNKPLSHNHNLVPSFLCAGTTYPVLPGARGDLTTGGHAELRPGLLGKSLNGNPTVAEDEADSLGGDVDGGHLRLRGAGHTTSDLYGLQVISQKIKRKRRQETSSWKKRAECKRSAHGHIGVVVFTWERCHKPNHIHSEVLRNFEYHTQQMISSTQELETMPVPDELHTLQVVEAKQTRWKHW